MLLILCRCCAVDKLTQRIHVYYYIWSRTLKISSDIKSICGTKKCVVVYYKTTKVLLQLLLQQAKWSPVYRIKGGKRGCLRTHGPIHLHYESVSQGG